MLRDMILRITNLLLLKIKLRFFARNSLNLGGFFDLSAKTIQIESLQEKMNQPSFWDDPDSANVVLRELKYLKSVVDPFEALSQKVEDMDELADICEEDEDSLDEIMRDFSGLGQEIHDLETRSLLGDKLDKNNVILSINAGAGGTESCDWTSMLLRMYTRFA